MDETVNTTPVVCQRVRKLSITDVALIAGSWTAVQLISNRLSVKAERHSVKNTLLSTFASWLETKTTGLYLLDWDKDTRQISIGFTTEADLLLFTLTFDGLVAN